MVYLFRAVFFLVFLHGVLPFLLDDSCSGRCGSFNRGASCQCNSNCNSHNDCCPDYASQCVHTSSSANCQTTESMAEQLWGADLNKFKDTEFKVSYQAHVADIADPGNARDLSNDRLFTSVNTTKLNSGTYALFRALLDNYVPAKGQRETDTLQELAEEDAFLNAILKTTVMDLLFEHAKCMGWITDLSQLKSKLIETWFQEYPRSGSSSVLDTSGFEHIMVGEYKTTTTVNGFHNWISFYEKEKSGLLNYYGYVSTAQPHVIGASFLWNQHYKAKGTFLIGESPEFSLAIYSMCFWAAPGKACQISLGGNKLQIQTYSTNRHIATAYIK